MKEEEAKAFWQRFDEQRKKSGLSIKEITDKLDLSYPLLITQRSRGNFPLHHHSLQDRETDQDIGGIPGNR